MKYILLPAILLLVASGCFSQSATTYDSVKENGIRKINDKNGNLIDSILYEEGKKVMVAKFVYYQDRHLQSEMIDNVKTNQFHYTIYDESGKVIVNYNDRENNDSVFINPEIEPAFPGGVRGWLKFILEQTQKISDQLNARDYGTYFIGFIVDTAGNLSEVQSLNMKDSKFGKSLAKEIASGPKWIPAQQNGLKVKAYRIQPVTMFKPQ